MEKYVYVARELRRSITDGVYAPGDKLPTIPQLCAVYGVSKITIKRAMDELELQGLIARRRGSGTFVKGMPSGPQNVDRTQCWTRLAGFTAEHESRGQRVSILVRSFDATEPDSGIAQELCLEPDELCYRVERTLFADGIPLQDQTLYIPMRIAPVLLQRHAESSIYRYLEEELGLNLASAHRRVVAANAGAEVAKRLQIGVGDAVLRINQVTYLDDGRPCEKSISTHAPGYEFFSIFTR